MKWIKLNFKHFAFGLFVLVLLVYSTLGQRRKIIDFRDLEGRESWFENKVVLVEGYVYTPENLGGIVVLCERDPWNEGVGGRMLKLNTECPKFMINGIPIKVRIHGVFKQEKGRAREEVIGSLIGIERLDMLEQNDYSWAVPSVPYSK